MIVSVRNYNYGSILQAYALQQELFAAGIDNELIYYKKRNVVKQALRIFNLPLLMGRCMTVLFCFHFNEKNNGGVKSLLDMLEVFSEKGVRIIAAFPFKDGSAIEYFPS